MSRFICLSSICLKADIQYANKNGETRIYSVQAVSGLINADSKYINFIGHSIDL